MNEPRTTTDLVHRRRYRYLLIDGNAAKYTISRREITLRSCRFAASWCAQI